MNLLPIVIGRYSHLNAMVVVLACAGAEAATTNAWQRTDAYVPPDFNGPNQL